MSPLFPALRKIILITFAFFYFTLFTILRYEELKASAIPYVKLPVYYHYNGSSNSEILVLMWTNFTDRTFDDGLIIPDCPNEFKCVLTKNQSLVSKSDVVLFHMWEMDWRDIPKERRQDQYYVFTTWESPKYTRNNWSMNWTRSFFNWTMTYRKDSDVPAVYGEIVERQSPLRLDLKELMKNKTRPIAWMASKCKAASQREHLVAELQKHIAVDIFGKCGSYECTRDPEMDIDGENSSTCGRIFEQNYKFYLAFENSLCDDYVTEKLFFRLKRYVVPIVMERKNYEHFSPGYKKPWFIAVDDFRSVKDLADYLLYLHQNDTAYYEYLSWHENYETTVYYTDADQLSIKYWCDACRLAAKKERKTIEDATTWWLRDTCRPGWKLR